VEWNQARYNEICDKLEKFLEECGFEAKKLKFVPVSGYAGENLIKPMKNWYKGPTFVEILGKLF
jgi:elongation factor 1 alpha-like protein